MYNWRKNKLLVNADFDTIYNAHSKMVYWTAYGITKENDRALDIMQTVFLRTFVNIKKLDGFDETQLRAWLYRVTMNAGRDVLRREKHLFSMEDAGVDMPTNAKELPESILLTAESRSAVRKSVDALPLLYREPILLYYFSELGYSDISRLLDVNEGTLKSRMSRGRALLYKQLVKEGESLERKA